MVFGTVGRASDVVDPSSSISHSQDAPYSLRAMAVTSTASPVATAVSRVRHLPRAPAVKKATRAMSLVAVRGFFFRLFPRRDPAMMQWLGQPMLLILLLSIILA